MCLKIMSYVFYKKLCPVIIKVLNRIICDMHNYLKRRNTVKFYKISDGDKNS